MAKYTHMRDSEARVWDRYLAKFGMPEGEITYDLRLGDGIAADPSWPAWMTAMAKALSQKRVDVVSETRDEVTIFEVKRRAGLSCVGQLMGYEALMFQKLEGGKPVRLVAVCESVEPDMLDVFEYYKIAVRIVGTGDE